MRNRFHCLLSDVLPASEHKALYLSAILISVHTGRKWCTRAASAARAPTYTVTLKNKKRKKRKEGERKRKRAGNVLSTKRCIIEDYLECDYLQPPSNAVHLPHSRCITSFYDGNGSLPRRAPIKGLRRFTFTRHRRPVFRRFPPTGWPPIFRPFRHETPTFRHRDFS